MAASSSPSRAELSADERIPSCYAALDDCSASAPSTTLRPKPPPLLPRQASSISGEASIYSLTLDELQNTLGESGKPLGSMNMDEFLRNIWTAEESEAMAVAVGSGDDKGPHHSWQQEAHRQGSMSLARTLSRKTVEDFLRDIAGAGEVNAGFCSESAAAVGARRERQITFAEMTLEDFLVKVGVVMKDDAGHNMQCGAAPFESSFDDGDGAGDQSGQSGALFGYQEAEDEKPNIKTLPMLSFCASELSPSQAGGEGPLSIKAGSPTSPLSDGVDVDHGSICALSPLSYNVGGSVCAGRKRGFECSLEKVVERRHRRMIKNRESAARSRARKQAYTVELEAEVLQLKNENMRLRLLQEEMADLRRKQFLDLLSSLGSEYMATKFGTLRRTQTGPW